MHDSEQFNPPMGPGMGHGGPWGRWGKGFGPQARRGDMRPIVLQMLAEKPMHGYEIIRALEAKSHGMWRPSPGSVYPMLQLLEEEDLVTGLEEQGKKIYTLTDAGRAEAARKDVKGPWHGIPMEEHVRARDNFVTLIGLLKQIAFSGTSQDRKHATEIMERTITELEGVLNERPQKGNQ